MQDLWEWLWYGALIFAFAFLMIIFLLPHKHQGYYLYVKTSGDFPVYEIKNNWSNWGDNAAYKTRERAEVLEVFKVLVGK